jgi:hypothetical protein
MHFLFVLRMNSHQPYDQDSDTSPIFLIIQTITNNLGSLQSCQQRK